MDQQFQTKRYTESLTDTNSSITYGAKIKTANQTTNITPDNTSATNLVDMSRKQGEQETHIGYIQRDILKIEEDLKSVKKQIEVLKKIESIFLLFKNVIGSDWLSLIAKLYLAAGALKFLNTIFNKISF